MDHEIILRDLQVAISSLTACNDEFRTEIEWRYYSDWAHYWFRSRWHHPVCRERLERPQRYHHSRASETLPPPDNHPRIPVHRSLEVWRRNDMERYSTHCKNCSNGAWGVESHVWLHKTSLSLHLRIWRLKNWFDLLNTWCLKLEHSETQTQV